jgi:hypothetical protein
MSVIFLLDNDKAKAYLLKRQKRMRKAKALPALARKLVRCGYFMLKRKKAFVESRFLAG